MRERQIAQTRNETGLSCVAEKGECAALRPWIAPVFQRVLLNKALADLESGGPDLSLYS